MENKNFSTEQNEWLNDLAYWMIQLGMFDEQPFDDVRGKIDELTYLDYFENGYSAKEAVEDDLSYA